MEYLSDTLHADFGSTPRGFLLPNLVGGVGWAASGGRWISVWASRARPVTSSVLSYGGLSRSNQPESKWGGVVATGPFARIGLFRERYGIFGNAGDCRA